MSEPPGGGEAPALEHEAGEVEPPQAGIGQLNLMQRAAALGKKTSCFSRVAF